MHEKDPQPKSLDYVNVLEELQHGDFFDALATSNDNVQNGMSKEEELEHIDTLQDLFGLEYINGSARIFAELHRSDMKTRALVDGDYFSVDAADYLGIEKRTLAGTPLFVCEFYDQTNKVSYYVDPRTFLQIEIAENEDMSEDIQQRLNQCITSSKGMLYGDDFLLAPFEEQQGLIGAMTDEIANDLDIIYGTMRVEMDCESYYHISDNDSEINLKAALIDQSDDEYEDRYTPSGTIVGCALLEQLETSFVDQSIDEQPGYTTPESFHLSGGIPCLIVRDNQAESLYFIQLDAIRNITCDVTPDEDDEA